MAPVYEGGQRGAGVAGRSYRVFFAIAPPKVVPALQRALPLVLVTFFFSLSGRIPQHRKVARWTFPIWLYVSVTGVITFVMLRLAQG